MPRGDIPDSGNGKFVDTQRNKINRYNASRVCVQGVSFSVFLVPRYSWRKIFRIKVVWEGASVPGYCSNKGRKRPVLNRALIFNIRRRLMQLFIRQKY